MGMYLDLGDVCYGHPRARSEFDQLYLSDQRYQKVRRLNPRQFTELYLKNIGSGTSFDDLVDGICN